MNAIELMDVLKEICDKGGASLPVFFHTFTGPNYGDDSYEDVSMAVIEEETVTPYGEHIPRRVELSEFIHD